jgi:hypothetical protein
MILGLAQDRAELQSEFALKAHSSILGSQRFSVHERWRFEHV